jgi:HlyD family secretion protein
VNRSLVLILLAAGAAFAGWWFLLRPHDPKPTEWQGYAEADFVKVGPTQQGLVIAVHAQRGDRIAKGAPLFEQDDTNDRANVDQMAHQLSQAQEQFANLQSGGKPTEIHQAEANLADAQAARDKIRSDLARSQSLLKTGYASAQVVDQQQADRRSAEAKVLALESALDQMRAPMGREGEIKMQAAAVQAAQAALDMARWRLDQRHVVSPVGGVIADVLARPGETLDAGAPVASILPPENIFVRFFVPEPDLAKVHQGDAVALSCDSCRPDLTATISFIAPQAEYTPPVIYSESTRAKFVFLVEAYPQPEQAVQLNPGQPVTVRLQPLPLSEAGRP